MERLIIAEKPKLAKAIAESLADKIVVGDNFYRVGDTIVAYCVGHILALAQPEDYDSRFNREFMSFENLPIFPSQWKLVKTQGTNSIHGTLKKLLSQAPLVIHAGDPDREGQRIVDEVLAYYNYRGPVQRLWLGGGLDKISIQRAFSDIRPNAEFVGLSLSALARAQGDWLVGMNISRAYTIAARRYGYSGHVRAGRIKTTVLAMIRDRVDFIENFQSIKHYNLSVKVSTNLNSQDSFSLKWSPSVDVQKDSEGRIIDRSIVQELKKKIARKSGAVIEFDEDSNILENPPLTLSLSTFQSDVCAKLNLSPKRGLQVLQELYENGYISYPRTDNGFLPESQHEDAKRILKSLEIRFGALARHADPTLKSSAWNDKKVTAHHGIIPTGKIGSLEGIQALVFDAISKFYIAQFYEPARLRRRRIAIDVQGERFCGSEKSILEIGWKAVLQDEILVKKTDEVSPVATIPNLDIGREVFIQKADEINSQTKPPPYFTENTIIHAMKTVHNSIEDVQYKELLKECKGIGTDATRADILADLIRSNQIFLSKKALKPTQEGRDLLSALHPDVYSPVLTAVFEQVLERVESKEIPPEGFVSFIQKFVLAQIERARTMDVKIGNVVKCPKCHPGFLSRIKLKHPQKGYFWGCSEYRKGNCSARFSELDGQPNFASK